MFEQVLATPALASLPFPAINLVRALRLWAVMRAAGQRPDQAVAEQLGSLRAAAHLDLLLEEVGAIWPVAFAINPFCCRRLSHDEVLLAEMFNLGRRDDRPAFDRLLMEMIPADERDRLFVSARALSRCLQPG